MRRYHTVLDIAGDVLATGDDRGVVCVWSTVVQKAQIRKVNATKVCELCDSTHMFDEEVLWCDNCNSSWHEYHKFVTCHTYDGHKTTSAEDNSVEKTRRTWICPYCVNESFYGTQGQVVRRSRDIPDDPNVHSMQLWPGGKKAFRP